MAIIKNSIKSTRGAHSMTQEELAKAIGVTRQTVISIEKGKYYPSLMIAFKVARIFNKSVEELFVFED